MASRRSSLLAVLLASALASSSVAHAQPTPADKEAARGFMAEGRSRREHKDLVGALDAFRAADALMHVPTTAYEVAATLVALGQLVEGRDVLLALGRSPAGGAEPAPFAEARRRAAELDLVLESRIPTLLVKVDTNGHGPEDVSVSLDGAPVATATLGFPRRLNPGHHTLALARGSVREERDVVLGVGETRTVLLRVPSDSRDTDLAKSAPLPLAEGPSPFAEAPAAEPRRPVPAITWIALGLTAAGVATGSVTGVMSLSATKSARESCIGNQCPPESYGDVDRAKTTATISTVAFGVAGGAAALALVTFLARPSASEAPKNAFVAPVIGPLSVGVNGRF